ncbi:TPA: DUF2213 domain-containing protein [Yersinia enterocolitica]|uniref:DUF2213 domain-containing protein n=1 Tax=Yersinia intermedia TaxID=631 RepID=A0ABX6FEH3_YERIN|nr:DUF2213 domain-containing protein [Yersinia intermedia]HDL6758873.1 DUF2213 domain-containing protein [Yersinia enterocolitica]QGR67067.1 DUF2213 domain-containing protein [Yersinia intermedia]QGR72083.1 DUF2213 domain-containing protein [Yersinia intermedia]HDM8443888.1 DUF2213 domain-containing protein [Yersinia enterocolitica]HDM9021952.1 DUF2213 domain-containing protein [Yersinia enterocolitica]
MRYFYTAKLGDTRFLQADGSLLCKDVAIARTGTQRYRPEEVDLIPGPDGSVLVYRTEDEVFAPETIASFEGVAVTLGHPEDDEGNIVFVNPSNFSELAHGHIQNVRRGTGDKSDLLLADVLIKRQEAIDAVNSGLTDVSCGYDALYEQIAPGKGNQYQITGNHLAAGIPRGRAGVRCAIGDSAPNIKKEKPAMSWLKNLAKAIKTKDEAALQQLIDEAPDMPSDGMNSIPGHTININVPSQATALPVTERTTTDNALEPENKTTDEDVPAWAQALIARIAALEGKTTDSEPDPDVLTTDEDKEEDAKVTADAAYRRNIISDAEIICPGFKPTGDKGLKRQVLNNAIRTGDSAYLKSFGIQDYAKVPKATVDAVFNGAAELNKAKNQITPQSLHTVDGAVNTKHASPAELNKIYAAHWAKNK